MQPIFDYGSIIYDNCSDSDKQMIQKAKLPAAQVISWCSETTPSNDVLTDINVIHFSQRKEKFIFHYC